jgi:hypothetical protein
MQRKFLFLQGPHGPFFSELAQQLTAAGAICHRIGFNRGDQAFWQDRKTYTPILKRLMNGGHGPPKSSAQGVLDARPLAENIRPNRTMRKAREPWCSGKFGNP